MTKFTVATMIFAISGQLFSNEMDDYCNLTKAQAEARSAAMAWPKLFGSIGEEPTTLGVKIYGGVKQSLSGFIQALVVNDVSYYQCRFYASNKSVRDNALHLDDYIFVKQAELQRPLLAEALKLAESNVEIEKKLFDSQNSTVAELTDAYATLNTVRLSTTTLEQKYSKLREMPAVDTELNLKKIAADARSYKAKAASLSSAIETLSAWDLLGSVGVKHEIATGNTSGFATANLVYSFGHIPSLIKTSKVEGLARNYVDNQYNSPQNIVLRQISAQKNILESEKISNASMQSQLKSTQELLARVKSQDSIRAKRAQRNLAIQVLTQEAALGASNVKIQELEKWLKTNAE